MARSKHDSSTRSTTGAILRVAVGALLIGNAGAIVAPQLALAQSAASLTPQKVLQQARQSYESRRQQLAVAQAYGSNWFPYSMSFKSSAKPGSPYYEPVAGGSGKTGGRLSLAGKAQPGDVLRISVNGGKQYALLVYAGEQTFVGETRSLFYYPFYTRLEFNVFPPRRHREHVEARLAKLKKQQGPLATLGKGVSFRYDENGWMLGRLVKSRKPKLYWKVSALQNQSYQLYRAVKPSRFEKMWAQYERSLDVTASYNPSSIVPSKPHLKNRCAIRLSHSLGLKVNQANEATYTRVLGEVVGPNQGGAGWYIRSLELAKRFRKQYGQPVVYTNGATAKAALLGKRGLVYWHRAYSDANHIDLWDGSQIGTNAFTASGIGDPFANAERVEFWQIKD